MDNLTFLKSVLSLILFSCYQSMFFLEYTYLNFVVITQLSICMVLDRISAKLTAFYKNISHAGNFEHATCQVLCRRCLFVSIQRNIDDNVKRRRKMVVFFMCIT